MTSLEWIEEEIETLERIIKVNTSLLSIFDENDYVAVEVLSKKIKEANDRLQTLQQIKEELEAWEVVKPAISIEHLEDCQIRIMYGENQFMNVSEEKATKVKKAMGVKDGFK